MSETEKNFQTAKKHGHTTLLWALYGSLIGGILLGLLGGAIWDNNIVESNNKKMDGYERALVYSSETNLWVKDADENDATAGIASGKYVLESGKSYAMTKYGYDVHRVVAKDVYAAIRSGERFASKDEQIGHLEDRPSIALCVIIAALAGAIFGALFPACCSAWFLFIGALGQVSGAIKRG